MVETWFSIPSGSSTPKNMRERRKRRSTCSAICLKRQRRSSVSMCAKLSAKRKIDRTFHFWVRGEERHMDEQPNNSLRTRPVFLGMLVIGVVVAVVSFLLRNAQVAALGVILALVGGLGWRLPGSARRRSRMGVGMPISLKLVTRKAAAIRLSTTCRSCARCSYV